MISIELQGKEQVATLLGNPILTALLKDRVYHPNASTTIELFGDFNFSLSMPADRLILTCADIKPRVTVKHFISIQGRLSSISIGLNDIIVALDSMPDLLIKLT